MATNGLKSSWQTPGDFPCIYCGDEFKSEGGRWQHWATNKACEKLRRAGVREATTQGPRTWKAADPHPKEVFEVHWAMNDGKDCECRWCVDYRESVAPVIIGRSSTAQTSRT